MTTQISQKWNKVKLGDCLSKIIGGGTPSKKVSSYWNGSVPWASVKDMSDGQYKINNTKDSITEEGLKNSASNLIKKETVVISTRMGLGRAAKTTIDLAINQDLKALIPNEKINNDFLLWLYLSKASDIQQLGTGATVAGVRLEDVRDLEVYLPNLAIQKKISNVLSAYDDLIENNNKRIKILEDIAQKIYTEWFINFRFPSYEKAKFNKDGLPEGWEIIGLNDCITIYRGKSYSSEDLVENGDSIPFVNLKCIKRFGGFRKDGLKFFSGTYKEFHKVNKGDIVMAVTDMTQERMIVARPARIPSLGVDFGVISMDLVKIEPKNNCEKDFLYSYFRWSDFSDNVKNHANGANVLHLIPNRITEYKFICPPKDLQKEFSLFAKNIFDEVNSIELSNENLKKSRDLLIPQLVTGKRELK